VTVKDIIYFVYDGWQVIEEHEAVRVDSLPLSLSSPIKLTADYVYGIGIDEPLRVKKWRELTDEEKERIKEKLRREK